MATKKKAKDESGGPAKASDLKVTVKVANPGGIHEQGEYRPCGSTYETDEVRASALGDLVEIVKD
jgi:hypothetical protein